MNPQVENFQEHHLVRGNRVQKVQIIVKQVEEKIYFRGPPCHRHIDLLRDFPMPRCELQEGGVYNCIHHHSTNFKCVIYQTHINLITQ